MAGCQQWVRKRWYILWKGGFLQTIACQPEQPLRIFSQCLAFEPDVVGTAGKSQVGPAAFQFMMEMGKRH